MPLPLLNPYFDLARTLTSSPLAPEQLEDARKKLIWAYSWAIPSTEAILAIAEHSPLIELGAGTGYWGWLLRQAGARVNCWDRNAHAGPHWIDVEMGSPENLSELPDLGARTLLLVWPPLDEPLAEDSLQYYTGKKVIYVGEWRGRTASARFHDRLESEFKKTCELELPRWPGFHDSLLIFER